MRRKIVCLSVLAAMLVLGSSPGALRAQVDFGVLGGWSTTDWDFEAPVIEKDDLFDGKNGYQVGAFVNVPMGDVVGVRGEVLYARKGAKTTLLAVDASGIVLGEFDTYYNVDYVQIPLVLNVFLGPGEMIRPVVFAGPYVGFEMSAKTSAELDEDPLLQDDLDRDLDETESPDFGFVFGGGFELRAGEQMVLFHVRYDLGLTEVFYTAKNEAWTAMVGLGF